MVHAVIDHDIGANPDDYFAILLALGLEGLVTEACISSNTHPENRAAIARAVLERSGCGDIPSYTGISDGSVDYLDRSLLPNTNNPPAGIDDFCDKLVQLITMHQIITYIAIGSLANLAYFLKLHPQYAESIRLFHMGPHLPVQNEPPFPGGTNVIASPRSSEFVLNHTSVPTVIVGSNTTIRDDMRVTPSTKLYQKLATTDSAQAAMLVNHLDDFHKRRRLWPALHDPFVVALAAGFDLVEYEESRIRVYEDGNCAYDPTARPLQFSANTPNTKLFMDTMAGSIRL
jgi:inosine-uridine nucleoside N-ribohydrolase